MGHYSFRYRYNGPVFRFGKFYGTYSGITEIPVSSKNPERRALNNLTFRCKKESGFAPTANLSLDPSKLVLLYKNFSYY